MLLFPIPQIDPCGATRRSMAHRIVLLSGPIGVGKSTLTASLEKTYGARIVKTRELLDNISRATLRPVNSRSGYQAFGEELDAESDGKWVNDALSDLIDRERPQFVVVDAVRISEQIAHIRTEHGFSVFHLHLTASEEDLKKRFAERKTKFEEASSYEEAAANVTEQGVRLLERKADAVVNTTLCNPEDVVVRVATHLRLYARDCVPTVDVLVGGQFGSEGKGHVASYLSREYDLLIRGGGQMPAIRFMRNLSHTFIICSLAEQGIHLQG